MSQFYKAVDLATALQAYAVRQKSDKTSDVNRLIQESNLRKTSFDKLFPAMFSLHGRDISEAINKAVKDKDITDSAARVALVAINNAMRDIAERYPTMDAGVFSQIDSILSAFITEFNVGGADTLSKDKVVRMEAQLLRLKELFKQPYIVAYYEGSSSKAPSVKIAHNSFSNLRDIINNKIKDAVSRELQANNITNSKLRDPTFLTTKIINWGHTQTDSSIITGKLLAELLSAKNVLSRVNNGNEIFEVISKDFLEQTGQEKTVIKLHQGDLTKGDPNVLQLVISSGYFQSAIVQNRRENQQDLGQLEKKWSFADAVGRTNLLKTLGVSSIKNLMSMLLHVRSSPSVIENISSVVVAGIKGKKHRSTEKTIPLLKNTTPIVKRKKTIKVLKKTPTNNLRQDTVGIQVASSIASLASLQVLINSHLAAQIEKNMGTGSAKRVLNYRTGRLANSANVERMTQSREGMITAFYSYMKNPYATFSDGGKQEYPKSRDPKLLISKSIREIAATSVGNRMRAVLS